MIPLETLPPGDPSGGVVYLWIVLSPEESSRLWVFLNISFNREGLLAPRPTPKLEDHPLSGGGETWNFFFFLILNSDGREIYNRVTDPDY